MNENLKIWNYENSEIRKDAERERFMTRRENEHIGR
jgi:hypothetical protein